MAMIAGLVAAAAMQAAPGAPTGEAVLAPAVGNTLVSTYPDGRIAKLRLATDHTYTGVGRKGEATAGRWSVSRARLCMKESKPIPFPFSWCTPLPPGGDLGLGWKAKAPTGEPITVRLQQGRG